MFFAVVVIFIISVILHFLYKVHYPKHHAILNKMPGPAKLPIVGTSVPAECIAQSKWVIDNLKKYGSGLTAKVLDQYIVFISKAEHFETVCSDKQNITKGYQYDYVQPWLGLGLLTSTGSYWHRQRKMLTPAFHFQILQEFLVTMNEHAQVLVDELRHKSASHQPIDICEYISMSALDIICETSMGHILGAIHNPDQPYCRAVRVFQDTAVQRMVTPWHFNDFIYYNLSTNGRKQAQALKTLHAFTNQVIAERECYLNDQLQAESAGGVTPQKRRPAFLDLLLAEKRKGNLNAREVREQMDTFMFEGHDTTASGIMWTLFCLAHHPECQKKAQNEIDNVLGSSTLITNAQLAELKYTDCCIKEANRLYAAVPQVARKLDTPLKLDEEITLPEGTNIFLVFYQLHHDPVRFPNPETYDPDRFTPDNTQKMHPYSYLPFSAGLRNCIGQRYAQMEQKVIVSHILKNFTLHATQSYEETEPAFTFVLVPQKGIWLKLEPKY